MPLREDILTPIPGDNPSGENLRYKPVYDKIKDARREDEDWAGGKKEADWATAVKLASDAIATKSKDLQLAAWLTEAMLKREQFKGLHAGLGLIQSLIENFWDTLYPESEDGDLELRATPVDWVGTRMVDAVRKTPITRYGYNFYQYRESRAVGYESDATTTDLETKRMTAIDEGKITAEAFDKQFNDTPKDYYKDAVADLEGCIETIDSLNELCETKFGEFHPTFTPLREAVDEVRRAVNELYQKKRALAGETDAPPEPEPVEEAAAEPEPAMAVSSGAAAAAPARAPVRKAVVGLDPADRDDAAARIAAIAKFLRAQDGYDPAPYLMLRGFRWGELRKDGASPNQALLEAPSTEVRQTLKKAMMESDWQAVIDAGEAAMAEPCGRGWLDLQRYVVTALDQWYPQIAAAVKTEVMALIKDIPDLRRWELMDGTATANTETQAWLDQLIAASSGSGEQASRAMQEEEEAPQAAAGEPALPDSYELAVQAMRQGRAPEAIEILATEVGHQSSGRGRFRRKQQLAELCIQAGKTAIAQPILEELVSEIDEHKLEEWESPDAVAYPLTMLLACIGDGEEQAGVRQKIYHRICRLDPVQALNCKP